VYSADETFLFSFGKKGGGPRSLSTPRNLTIDESRGLIYVVDFMRHTILVYDLNDGHFLFEFGGKGTGLGWFAYPNDIAIDRNGRVFIADLFNHRVQILHVEYEREISQTPQQEQPFAPQPPKDVIKVILPGESLTKPTVETSIEEKTTDEFPPGFPDDIIEEEIIKETPTVKLPAGDFVEPLDTPIEDIKN
jgi:hypothetical protein